MTTVTGFFSRKSIYTPDVDLRVIFLVKSQSAVLDLVLCNRFDIQIFKCCIGFRSSKFIHIGCGGSRKPPGGSIVRACPGPWHHSHVDAGDVQYMFWGSWAMLRSGLKKLYLTCPWSTWLWCPGQKQAWIMLPTGDLRLPQWPRWLNLLLWLPMHHLKKAGISKFCQILYM